METRVFETLCPAGANDKTQYDVSWIFKKDFLREHHQKMRLPIIQYNMQTMLGDAIESVHHSHFAQKTLSMGKKFYRLVKIGRLRIFSLVLHGRQACRMALESLLKRGGFTVKPPANNISASKQQKSSGYGFTPGRYPRPQIGCAIPE